MWNDSNGLTENMEVPKVLCTTTKITSISSVNTLTDSFQSFWNLQMWHDNVIGDKTTVWNKLPSASSSMSMAVVSSSNEDILPQDEVDLAPQRERWRRKDFMVEDATQDVMNAKSEFYEKPRWDLRDDRIWGVQHFSKRLLSRCVTGSSRLTIPLLWRNALRMHLLMSDALFVRKF